MSRILSHEEISIIEKTLSSEQSEFLARKIRNNVYDIMLGKLVNSGKIRRLKNVDDEDLYYLADEYELIERRVAGEGERFTCDEGHKNLKYLYVVRNVEDGKIIKLGGTCLKNLTGLSGDVVNALMVLIENMKGFYCPSEMKNGKTKRSISILKTYLLP